MDEVKLIKVKANTWKELMYLKIELGASSLDDVIRSLLDQHKTIEEITPQPPAVQEVEG